MTILPNLILKDQDTGKLPTCDLVQQKMVPKINFSKLSQSES